MKKIKETLIHWLGGITNKECEHKSIEYALAYLIDTKKYADSLYGIPTEEWATKVYKKLSEKINILEEVW